jgi:putative flippase GtrA
MRLMRYALTGGTAAVVDLGGFVLLQAAGLALAPAAGASFLLAAGVNFVLTARFVFGAAPTGRRWLGFLLGALAGLAVNMSVTVLAAALLGLPGWAAKTVGIGVAFGFNYLVNARLVFRAQAGR